MSGWESPSNVSGHEESSVRGRGFNWCTHGNPLCSISMLHFNTPLVSVLQIPQSHTLYTGAVQMVYSFFVILARAVI